MRRITTRLAPCRIIYCASYREVFNPRRQHFRLQKQHPALILAQKKKGWLQASPYGLGGTHNYYFSHILNCIYDCSYCFLQGMYSSAHLVLFINYEDFFSAIAAKSAELAQKDVYFFSGYDGDSLAYEPVSRFVKNVLPFFAQHPRAILELRTKSVQIAELLRYPPIPNCVVAFSLSPPSVVARYEHKTPSLVKRLNAMTQLARHGWQLGIRLDPLIWEEGWQDRDSSFIEDIAAAVPDHSLHSITLGALRFPRSHYDKMVRLYPTHSFLVKNIIVADNKAEIKQEIAAAMIEYYQTRLMRHYAAEKFVSMMKQSAQEQPAII